MKLRKTKYSNEKSRIHERYTKKMLYNHFGISLKDLKKNSSCHCVHKSLFIKIKAYYNYLFIYPLMPLFTT